VHCVVGVVYAIAVMAEAAMTRNFANILIRNVNKYSNTSVWIKRKTRKKIEAKRATGPEAKEC